MNAATLKRNRLFCLIIALLAAATLAWGQGKGKKPPKTPPAPPTNSFLAFDSGGDVWLSDAVSCGKLLADGTCPTWSPDGDWIAFRRQDPASGWGIYKAPIDGSAPPSLITLYPSSPYTPSDRLDWSPCATATGSDMILFACYPTGEVDMDVYAINPDGTGLVKITAGPGYWTVPRWGANADKITATFASVPMTFGFTVVVCHLGLDGAGDLAITGQTQLTHVMGSPIQNMQGTFAPALSNDGSWVACRVAGGLVGGSNDEIYKIDVQNPSNLIRITFDPDQKHFGPIFSPNDAQVLFTTSYTKGNRKLIATADAWGGSPTPTYLTPGFKNSQFHVDIKP